jgi:phosphatidylglycerol:prolipoprotein diacylglycerol transferase
MLGLSIGRIGCTINGDAAGTPTSLPWAFTYTHPDSFAPLWVATHPAPVYEILWIMAILGLLWWLKGKIKPDGSLFLVMLAAYSFGRFIISWARDEGAVLGPLHQSHIISLVLFVAAVFLLFRLKTGWVKSEPVETKAQETRAETPSSPVS